MTFDHALAALATVVLMIYLVYALLRPEHWEAALQSRISAFLARRPRIS